MYYSASDFYKTLFDSKVYKISIDAGCTCPTRDGTLGTNGCIFCSAAGSGDFVPSARLSIAQQVEEAKKLVQSKVHKPLKYIAYFQNFTNTYGNPEELYAKYCEAILCPEVVGIAIGTRPDCLSEEILDKISLLAEKTFVQIELGFQTCKESSAEYIRRGYKNEVFNDAVEKLHRVNKNIHIVTHIIFGLPGESKEDMLSSVDYVLKAGIDGIKITSLYVLRGTDLQKDYEAGKCKALEMEEYFDLLKAALKIIPSTVVVHRLTGDGPKSLLIAPMWTADKKRVLNRLKEQGYY
ncbi:MAG: TIGR01212 family radical SAM protein [Treponema sp.]|nr:TIGR01212 family radical SAM protein [Treponema sp.]